MAAGRVRHTRTVCGQHLGKVYKKLILDYVRAQVQSWEEGIPLEGGVGCPLLAEGTVVIPPALSSMAESLSDNQPGVCERVSCCWVGGKDRNVPQETITPGG